MALAKHLNMLSVMSEMTYPEIWIFCIFELVSGHFPCCNSHQDMWQQEAEYGEIGAPRKKTTTKSLTTFSRLEHGGGTEVIT